MTETKELNIDDEQITKMFEVGAHYAYTKSKRHPSTKSFIFGAKNGVDIFDLEKTKKSLEEAKEFVGKVLETAGKQILFVGSKSEAKNIVKEIAEGIEMPIVSNRWVGGTLTNFDIIKKRADRLLKLREDKESGELLKYTKKERNQLDKEVIKLERKFGGITSMKTLPSVVFVIDPRYESVAVEEAKQKNIPVVALANSDCSIKEIDYPILANDTSNKSIQFFTEEIASVCKTVPKTKK